MSSSVLDRFRESMVMNHERWHDGTGYDLDLLKSATDDERTQIEHLLTTKSVDDWRDVEALACIDTPRARDLLRRTFDQGSPAMKTDIISHAPDLFSEDERAEVLATLLAGNDDDGFNQAMLIAEEFHPPPVVKALVSALRTRDSGKANEIAMMLLVIHGKAESLYDLEVYRSLPDFSGDGREKHVRELCEGIGLSMEEAK